MPVFLNNRATAVTESMDDPNCNLIELENTYRQFSRINELIAGWQTIYKKEIRPSLRQNSINSLLDIGFGGGDIPLKLAKWAANDGFELRITAIDPDPRAFNFVQQLVRPSNVEFLQCELSDLDPSHRFDFIISNHVLHHLTKQQLIKMLEQSQKLSRKKVIFNDGRRSDWAYALFNIFSRPVFRSSFITEDGLISIKRSYTFEELIAIVPDNWIVESFFPFRLLLKYYH